MALPSLAFSVHNFISSTGADAGFAAIVGLAILVLLYFVHARETANLREEAALLTQRLQHAEARVAQLTRIQAAAESQAPQRAVATAPFAPAGMGAPALASATHVIPIEVVVPEPEEPIVVQRPAVAPVPAMAMAAVSAPAAAAAPPEPPVLSPSPFPAPATSAGGNGSGRPADRPPLPSRPVTGRRPQPPLGLPPRRRRSRLGRGIAVALVALVAVAAAVVLFAITSIGGSGSHSPGSPTTNALTPGHGGAAAFKPSSVTVAVLNGTSINQLAHRVGTKLVGLGYREGALATAANQTETKTTVAYLPGRKNRTGALHVATALGLGRSVVQPVNQSTLQVACPGPSSCTANVVVTVGTNLSTE